MESFIKDAIKEKLTSTAREKIAEKLGVGTKDADSSIDTSLDAILGGLAQGTKKSSKNAKDLDDAIKKDHDGSILDNITEMIGSKDLSKDGGKILEHVFGNNKDKIAEQVGKETKLDSKKAGGLLDMLAPMVMGQLGKTKKDDGLDAGGISDMLSNNTSDSSGIMGMVMGFLDKDNDGSVLDDLAGMVFKNNK